MAREFLAPHEWYELKGLCGRIYQKILAEERIDDYMQNAVLKYLDLPVNTVCDWYPFGSIQFKMITTEITLLYNHSTEIEKRQIFLYATQSKQKQHIRK
jgi:hypothetical protein